MFGSTQFCVGGGFSGLHGSVQAVSAQHCLALGFFRGGFWLLAVLGLHGSVQAVSAQHGLVLGFFRACIGMCRGLLAPWTVGAFMRDDFVCGTFSSKRDMCNIDLLASISCVGNLYTCEATCNRTLLTSVCCKCEARNP